MVVKKDQLNVKKGRNSTSTFEKIFFIVLTFLSLLFLLVTCWILLTGDDVIFLHGSSITPRHLCFLFSIQSFFLGRAVTDEQDNNSAAEPLVWSF